MNNRTTSTSKYSTNKQIIIRYLNNKYSDGNIEPIITKDELFLSYNDKINYFIEEKINILFVNNNKWIKINLNTELKFIYKKPIKNNDINIHIITLLENAIIKILQQTQNIDKYQILKIVNTSFIYYIKFNIPLEIPNYSSLIEVSQYNKIMCYIKYRNYSILNLQYLLCKNTKNQITKYVIMGNDNNLHEIIKLKIKHNDRQYEQIIEPYEQTLNEQQINSTLTLNLPVNQPLFSVSCTPLNVTT